MSEHSERIDDPVCEGEVVTPLATLGFARSEATFTRNPADAGVDPFFTDRVLRALPPSLPMTTRILWRRISVLAGFHLLAGVFAYLTLWVLVPDELLRWVDWAHDWADRGSGMPAPSWVWLAVAGVAATGIAMVAGRPHTPPA